MARAPRPTHCLNCAQPVEHAYCAHCGQENHDYRESLWPLVGDLAEELFQLESRIWRSLAALLFKPGELTAAYNQGRRVRYTSPLRLYVLLAGAYFFGVAIVPSKNVHPIQIAATADDAPNKAPPRWLKPLQDKMRELQKLDGVEVSRRVEAKLDNYVPRVVALMVPLFALMLKLFYRRRFYVEHLIFSLHVTAFGFVLLLPNIWLIHSKVFTLAASAGWSVYLALAQRRVYGERWLPTLVKATGLMLLFCLFATLVMIPFVIAAFLNA